MVIEADGDVIGAEHVSPELIGSAPQATTRAEPRTFVERKAEAERQIIVSALERNEWHITRTAEELGLADHASLLKIMRRHGISRPTAL
jgi:transcriptional regulator with GAF, ATPase, and Fis domain